MRGPVPQLQDMPDAHTIARGPPLTAAPTIDARPDDATAPGHGAASARRGAPDVEIQGVTKRFGPVTAVDGMQLSIERGEFYSLLGPSG